MKERDTTYLKHVLDSIRKIQDYMEGMDSEDFEKEPKTQSAVIREMEVIGEATKQITKETKEENPEIPWQQIAGMRDKLIHGYFQVDLNIVWRTYEEEIPRLKKKIQELLKEN